MTADAADDTRFMQAALAFGRRSLGLAAPNPSVGALVVRGGLIVGRGCTHAGGRPHAEAIALADAGEAARGATLYVTLEPCSHTGRTPPCADAIIAAGIARVVSAMDDPDPRVAGSGHARLEAAGVKVTRDVCAEMARRANLGHILRMTSGRPMVTLKLAQTADGYAAGDTHDARLHITGEAANAAVQMQRAMHDAIMVGIGTILGDDPLMTVRLPGVARKPLRIVLDTQLQLPLNSRLAATVASAPILVIAGESAARGAEARLKDHGIGVLRVAQSGAETLDLGAALQALGDRGLTRVYSEGGPRIAAALIAERLVDEALIYISAKPLGRAGTPALSAAARAALADISRYGREDHDAGPDRLTHYEARR